MWERLLLALDQYEPGENALSFAAAIAQIHGSSVQVLHVRELSRLARVNPIDTVAKAEQFVAEAVDSLGRRGLSCDGRVISVLREHTAHEIVEEAEFLMCDAIVLGSRRLAGFDRLSGKGTRERVLRLTFLPVLVAPGPLSPHFTNSRRLSLRDQAGSERKIVPPPPRWG